MTSGMARIASGMRNAARTNLSWRIFLLILCTRSPDPSEPFSCKRKVAKSAKIGESCRRPPKRLRLALLGRPGQTATRMPRYSPFNSQLISLQGQFYLTSELRVLSARGLLGSLEKAKCSLVDFCRDMEPFG